MLQVMVEPPPSPGLLRLELKNSRPVDLVDLAVSFRAFGELYSDWAHRDGWDVKPQNLRLYVQTLRTGSVIADLAPYAEQANWVLEQAKSLAPFAKDLHGLIKFFMGAKSEAGKPTNREAGQLAAVLEPVAKDGGSQLNVFATAPVNIVNNHYHFSVPSLDANAVQNAIRRQMGPQLPAEQFIPDQLLVLRQMRFDGKARVDRGVIEAITPKELPLRYMNPEARRLILDVHENPGHMAFVVDVVLNAIDGKPAAYRIKDVKDAFERPE